jgi:hypothetical protein
MKAPDQHRCELGISMERMSRLMGSAERGWAKYLCPDAPSGRVACWATIQKAFNVLYPGGFAVQINPADDRLPATASMTELAKVSSTEESCKRTVVSIHDAPVAGQHGDLPEAAG